MTEPTDTVEAARMRAAFDEWAASADPAKRETYRTAWYFAWEAARADERSKAQPEGALRAALWRFGSHKHDCKREWAERVAGEGAGWPCTCGFDAALDGAPYEPSAAGSTLRATSEVISAARALVDGYRNGENVGPHRLNAALVSYDAALGGAPQEEIKG